MRELFVRKTFTPESQALIDVLNNILRKYAAAGYDLSLRQLYYQLVAGDLLPKKWADPQTGSTNNERSYKNIGSLVSDARLAGLMDWDMIKDRGRELVRKSTWTSIADIAETAASQFRLKRWATQPCYIEVMVEKQALEGVLLPVCEKWLVPFTANKGYSSSSALYEAGKRLEEQHDLGKHIHLVYLGDHDPSGIDMTRDVADRLAQFSRIDADMLSVHRVALNMDQVEELNPPENPAKITDSRAKGYIQRFGDKSWELDAIEPKMLAQLVEDQIEAVVDEDLWHTAVTREEEMRNSLNEFAKKHRDMEDDAAAEAQED